MAKGSESPLPNLLMEEILSDGSTLTNPAADYRKLFVGEDGLLHLKDSAGTVTDVGAGALATDSLWDAAGDLAVGSGANTAARLAIGAVGGHLSRINGVVAWDSGTSNPGAAVAGDRAWRSDLGEIIYYDGTRWLTETIYEINQHNTSAGISASEIPINWPMYGNTYGIWLIDFRWIYRVNTTHSGTQYWAIELHSFEAGGPTDTTIATLTSDKATINTYINPAATAVGVAVAANVEMIFMSIVKTSTPGTLLYAANIRYRRIIT